MRAIRVPEYGAASVLTETALPTPRPDATEVCLDVVAAGVNFADVAKRRREYPGGPTPPYTPGIEVAGRVTQTGPETDFSKGDAVMAYTRQGGYAETVSVAADRVFPIPDTLSIADAAAIPIQWLTAHNVCFEWGGLERGDRVLVQAGAGGVGSAAIQLASNAGATVIAMASTAEKRSFAERLGAPHAIDYVDDIVGELEGHLDHADGESDAGRDGSDDDRDESDDAGHGSIDLVLDSVGGDVFRSCFDALAPGGRIVTFGLASGDVPSVSTPRLFFDNHSVVGYHLGHAATHQPNRVFGALDPLRSLLADGEVEVIVDQTFDLEEAVAAHEYLEDRRTRGKVLLEP